MITYLSSRGPRRYRKASLSFSPLRTRVARWCGVACIVGAGFCLSLPAKAVKAALWTDLTRTTVVEWLQPRPLAVIAISLAFIGCAALIAWAGGRSIAEAVEDWKVRRATASEADFGPGLKSRPRLET